MRDSRLDRIASSVADALVEADQTMQVRIVADALYEYVEFANEFGLGDGEIQIVTVRLRLALRHAEIGNRAMGRAALRLAHQELQQLIDR